MIDSAPALSRLETGLLAGWQRAGRARVTLDDIALAAPEHDPSAVAARLVAKGLLYRLGPGVFLVRALRTAGRPWSPTAVAAAAALLAEEPYYLGGWWALSFHRLSQQVYASVLDAFVTRRRRRREVPGTRILFHILPMDAFTWGINQVLIEDQPVRVSDPERTVLDALEHPAPYATIRAGLAVVVDALKARDLDRSLLVDYALRGARPSTRARLGFLLEEAGTSASVLKRLERGLRLGDETLVSLVPGGARRGQVRERWSVLDNRDATPPNA